MAEHHGARAESSGARRRQEHHYWARSASGVAQNVSALETCVPLLRRARLRGDAACNDRQQATFHEVLTLLPLLFTDCLSAAVPPLGRLAARR